MKTAEKILLTSLDMFNVHGEANVTCVDIAIELDISPGNLYYHYKGKEVLVSELFSLYLERTGKILVSPDSDNLTLVSFFEYLLQLLESAHLFRFIYRNPTDLIEKYPTIERKFKRLVKSKEEAFIAILAHFKKAGIVDADNSEIQALAQVFNLMFTQSQSYFLLKGIDINEQDINSHSLLILYHMLSPYLTISEQDKLTLLTSLAEQTNDSPDENNNLRTGKCQSAYPF
jgi:AcrR family transcriptional regulator